MPDQRVRFLLDSIWKGQGIKQAKKDMGGLSGAVKGLGAKLFATVGGAMALNKAVHGLADAAKLAARVETLGVVTATLGRSAGLTTRDVRELEANIQSLGITTQGSRQAVARMIQANIDLGEATNLATMAQDAAVIAGTNSTDAFNRLVNTIVTGNVRMGRQLGLQLQFGKALQATAKELGKNVEDLTAREQIMAKTNEVLRQGVRIEGAYTSAMKTAGKVMWSLDRVTEELKLAIGDDLLPVLRDMVFWLYETIPPITSAIREQHNYRKELEALGYTTNQYGLILDENRNIVNLTREEVLALAEARAEENEHTQWLIDTYNLLTGEIEDLGDATEDTAEDIGEIESAFDGVDTSIGNTIARYLEMIDFMQAGGQGIVENVDRINAARDRELITIDQQEKLLREALIHATELEVTMGNTTPYEAAKKLADELGIAYGDARRIVNEFDGKIINMTLRINQEITGYGVMKSHKRQHGGQLGPITKVGEAGWEYIIGNTVIPHGISKKLEQLGVGAGEELRSGGRRGTHRRSAPYSPPPPPKGGAGKGGSRNIYGTVIRGGGGGASVTAAVSAEATEQAIEQKIEQSVEAIATIGSTITRGSQEQAQRQIAATDRQTRASRQTNKLLAAILGAVQAGGTQEGLADSLASAVSLMETE